MRYILQHTFPSLQNVEKLVRCLFVQLHHFSQIRTVCVVFTLRTKFEKVRTLSLGLHHDPKPIVKPMRPVNFIRLIFDVIIPLAETVGSSTPPHAETNLWRHHAG